MKEKPRFAKGGVISLKQHEVILRKISFDVHMRIITTTLALDAMTDLKNYN